MNYNTSGGNMTTRFNPPVLHFDGDTVQGEAPDSVNTILRMADVDKIRSMPGDLDTNVTYIFRCFMPQCTQYVEAKGEIPSRRPLRLAAQVCLLRAQDIANQAKALDISDSASLETIEETEEGSQSINSPDTYTDLPTLVQAAVYITLDEVAQKTPQGTMQSIIDVLRGDVDDESLSGFSDNTFTVSSLINNADGDDDDDTDGDDDTTSWAPVSISGPSLATIGGDTGSISVAGNTTASALVPSSSSTAGASSGGIIGLLSGLVSNASGVASTATSIANAVKTSSNAVTSIFGSVGASSLAQYLNNNKALVAAWAIGIILIIVIIVYASKHSN